MTFEQMEKVVNTYCEVIAETTHTMCENCRIEHLCEQVMGDFKRQPDILKQAYDIVGDTPSDWCCNGCLYDDRELHEYPCTKCKANTVQSDPNYGITPYLWTPVGEPKPIPKAEVKIPIAVHHPSHYNQGKIECIDAMESAFGKEAVENFCLVNAFKYVWRTRDKNGLEDVKKAIWYLNKYKELVESD